MYSTISADIVSSTKLSSNDVVRIQKCLDTFLCDMCQVSNGSWGRVVKGDALECVLSNPKDALKVALMLKCFIKTFVPTTSNSDFSRFGVRVAIGIGDLRTNDAKNGIIDGDAIYKSGRMIDKKGVLAHGTMNVVYDGANAELLTAIAQLCDVVINKSTAKQCFVLYQKMRGEGEDELAKRIGKSRSTINAHSSKAGWPAISNAIKMFENLLTNQ